MSNERGSRIQVTRRGFVIGAALAGASGAAYARLPQPRIAAVKTDALEKLVPNSIGLWQFVTESGLVLPPSDAFSDRLYDNLITRVYSSPAAPAIMLLIAYNNTQDGVVQVHRPEVCYPAGGYRISPTEPASISREAGPSIPANAFTAVGPQRTEQVLYWTRIGNAFPRSWAEQRLAVARSNLAGLIPDGALVRASLIGADQQAALLQLKEFVKELEQIAPPLLKRVLTGS